MDANFSSKHGIEFFQGDQIIHGIFDRELRSKVLTEALLLFLLFLFLVWKYEQKMVWKEQKMFANENCSISGLVHFRIKTIDNIQQIADAVQ